MSQNNSVYQYCEKSTQYSIHSRRCFMTGELCSKQSSVHRERERLHSKNQINAFVVMNFSDMSDVVYKWKLRSFIESLKQYLFLKKESDYDHDGQLKTTTIACVAHGKENLPGCEEDWVPVEQIHVIRADSNTESNYVICDRVCQQMQIADLVIVDVSVENTNVFYEFGMAAAFGKLILPICYNESFYQMHIPEAAKAFLEEERRKQAQEVYTTEHPKDDPKLESLRKMIEHHIDCYPWRRKLFEYYGIRYRKGNSEVGYTSYKDITNPVLGFSDIQYTRFPYDHKFENDWAIPMEVEVPKDWETEKEKSERKENPYYFDVVYDEDRKKVGYHLYNRLRASYNQKAAEGNVPSPFNTLVVYTMDSVLNGEQAGQCIINYYRNMTARIREEYCFCGDRVGILGQSNKILDDPKDTKTDQKLMYKVSDIIRIGMNEATHMATQKKIKTEDYLATDPGADKNEQWTEEAIRFVKEHIRNRCIPAYPDEPIYVKQLQTGVQKDVLRLENAAAPNVDEQEQAARKHFFNLFHVMLHTLSYTNEIVVDLSRNSLQALFWLGVAHGSDVHAITVRHMPTEQELKRIEETEPSSERHIFDVAGLWTAILRSSDTDGFYQQLTKAQVGIEQSNKLILPDSEKYQERVMDQYHAPSPYMKGGYSSFQDRLKNMSEKNADELDADDAKKMLKLLRSIGENERLCKIWEALTEQNQKESEQLESYYRTCFWRRMLRQNALHLYIPEKKGRTEGDKEPCRVNISWDVNATTELSHYLSKRLMIGSYRQTMLRETDPQPDVKKQNFITIGNDTKPFRAKSAASGEDASDSRQTLVDYARDELKSNQLRRMMEKEVSCPRGKQTDEKMKVRGFFAEENALKEGDFFAWFPTTSCIKNMKNNQPGDPKENTEENRIHFAPECPKDIKSCGCSGTKQENACYKQLAQLVLWREISDENRKEMRFWVSMVGVSGPATLALTTLLVNPDQQEELFKRNGKPNPTDADGKKPPQHLLNRLQSRIRSDFLKKYNELLERRMGGDQLKKVTYSTNLYLSTVLYQYFFPFLTRADEMRITNGMRAFLVADNQLVGGTQTTVNVLGALEEAMKTLQGVEALYTVMVQYSDSDTDSRWPKGIKPLEHNGVSVVNCLFRSNPGRQTDSSNT